MCKELTQYPEKVDAYLWGCPVCGFRKIQLKKPKLSVWCEYCDTHLSLPTSEPENEVQSLKEKQIETND